VRRVRRLKAQTPGVGRDYQLKTARVAGKAPHHGCRGAERL
jgi:hypothetical protein